MKQKKKQIQPKKSPNVVLRLVCGIIFLFITIVIPILLSKGDNVSPSLLSSEMGMIGSLIYKSIKLLFGSGGYLLPVLTLITSIFFFFPKLNIKNKELYGLIGIYLILLAYLHLNVPIEKSFEEAWSGNNGGLFGAMLSFLLVKLLGHTISKLVLFTLFLIILIIGSNGQLFNWIKTAFIKVIPFMKTTKKEFQAFIYESEDNSERIREQREYLPNKKPFSSIKAISETVTKTDHTTVDNEDQSFTDNIKNINYTLKENDKLTKIEQFIDETPYQNSTFQSQKRDSYQYPSFDLLYNSQNETFVSEKEIEKNAEILLQTLNNFGVKGSITGISVGPAITEYEFQPAPGIKISKIINLADDLALNLAAHDIRIQAPIPGKAAVGIEVPNKKKSSVSIRGIIESDEFLNNTSKIIAALGKDISGENVIADLANMPHLLIAGSTGSGKSVCLNALIISVLYKSHPDEVKFLMIDPKMVELASYNDIPHLITPVVTNAKKAASALRWAVQEMENRYALFAEAGVKDLDRYNKKMLENLALNKSEDIKILPKILIIIDELADLMMVSPNDVEDAICRLAQMARAAGMHLIIATQRPSVDVITGIIKANISSRIAFAVSSQIDSRTILDMSGAEKLLGQGDMLYYPRGIAKPIRVQGCYVSDKEIESIVERIKTQGAPIYNESIQSFSDDQMDEASEMPDNKDFMQDELLSEAALLFIENGQASISMLQRNFRIGYTRAARIIDTLADLGYIGPYEGSKPRKIIMTLDEHERIFGMKEESV